MLLLCRQSPLFLPLSPTPAFSAQQSKPTRLSLTKRYKTLTIDRSSTSYKQAFLSDTASLKCKTSYKTRDLSRSLVVSAVVASNAQSYGSSRSNNFPFVRVGECLVLPANPRRAVSGGKPRGIVSFFGGAFVGAAPEATYRWLLEALAQAGYLVIAVPYQLTFDHSASVTRVHARLQACLNRLKGPPEYGLPSTITQLDVDNLPLFGVGHSNGALLQVLQGSMCQEGRLPDGNVMVSFNNKPASQAVPGFDQLGPSLSTLVPALQGSGVVDIAQTLADEATKAMLSAPLPLPPGWSKDDLWPLMQLAEQVQPVLGQVASGVSEFTPSPEENRILCASSYKVPRNLLIKFRVDSIDESDILAGLLRPLASKEGCSLEVMDLPGTHLTPLSQEIKWDVGEVFTPWDAINQGVRVLALADMRRLISTVVSWLDAQTR